MKETVGTEIGEYLEKVDLATAITLNKELWRKRDTSISLKPAIELSESFTNPVINRVLKTFEKYVDKIHIKNSPIVGFSSLPESVISWGHADYGPDCGPTTQMKLFQEFGVEWLANVAYEQNPFEMNYYLYDVVKRIKKSNFSTAEDLLLGGIVGSLKTNTITKEEVTDLFAKVLISGNTDDLQSMTVKFPDGSIVNYNDRVFKANDIRKASKVVEFNNVASMRRIKPFVFAISAGVQLYFAWKKVSGYSQRPGVINICGSKPEEIQLVTIAHEYIHNLGFHEDNWNGFPVNGYKLNGGVIVKQHGKT